MNLKGNLTSKGLQGSIGKSRMQGILGTNPAAIPITVDNALSLSSTNPVQNKVITAAITNRLLSDDVKNALLQIAQKVAYSDTDGQDYYDDLYDALYPPTNLDSIGAVFDSSATIYNTDTLDDLKQYLTVTAYYTDGTSETVTTYTLSGSMDAGTQTITVSYGGKTTTFTVTVVEWLVSIDAVFTQGSATFYDTDSLDTLRQYLVVTATYADSTTATVTDYTLSGTLTEGTSTITVSYGGKTDTFTVTGVVHVLFRLAEPFVSTGTEYIDTGVVVEANNKYSVAVDLTLGASIPVNDIRVVVGNIGTATKYLALQTQRYTSGGAAGTYLWGGGLTFESSKNYAVIEHRYRYVYTFDASTYARTATLRDITADAQAISGSGTATAEQINGTNIYIGSQDQVSTVSNGFIGTVNECIIFDRILTAQEISDYLEG